MLKKKAAIATTGLMIGSCMCASVFASEVETDMDETSAGNMGPGSFRRWSG